MVGNKLPFCFTNFLHLQNYYKIMLLRRIAGSKRQMTECQSRFPVVRRCLVVTRSIKCGVNQIHIHVRCRVEGVRTVCIQEKLSCSKSASSAQNHCMRMRWSTANVDRHWRIFRVRHHPLGTWGRSSQWPNGSNGWLTFPR